MAWLTDPRKWDDAWWGGLSFGARWVWESCLTGPFRTVLPGLCRNVSLLTIHDALTHLMDPEKRPPVEQTERDLAEALAVDKLGKIHMMLDPVARVARIPMAPAYNHADNPNVLTSWYRAWRDVPDCELKFAHIESLRLGVNFAYVDKHGRRSMADKWEATFGQPEKAYLDGGKKLKTYVDLRERWVPGKQAEPAPESPQTSLAFVAPPPEPAPSASNGHTNGARPAAPPPRPEAEPGAPQRPRLPPGLE